MQRAPRVGIANALQVREIRKGWKDWEVLNPMVMFKAGLSASQLKCLQSLPQ